MREISRRRNEKRELKKEIPGGFSADMKGTAAKTVSNF